MSRWPGGPMRVKIKKKKERKGTLEQNPLQGLYYSGARSLQRAPHVCSPSSFGWCGGNPGSVSRACGARRGARPYQRSGGGAPCPPRLFGGVWRQGQRDCGQGEWSDPCAPALHCRGAVCAAPRGPGSSRGWWRRRRAPACGAPAAATPGGGHWQEEAPGGWGHGCCGCSGT